MMKSFVLGAAIFAVGVCAAFEFADLGGFPDRVTVEGPGFTNGLVRTDDVWSSGSVAVTTRPRGAGAADVSVSSPDRPLSFVRLTWKRALPPSVRRLGDAWERAYGNLAWRGLDAQDPMPWYFLVSDGTVTHGCGVAVQPNAFACWRASADEIELALDLRAGSQPVRLGTRTLAACTIVSHVGKSGESAFAAGRALCRAMCPRTRLPKEPVYGYNDWYCAYGKNTATNFLADAAYITSLVEGVKNRPYVVMDDGWQENTPPLVHESGRGPWDHSGPAFGMEMSRFAKAVKALHARPGLWYRPFRAWKGLPVSWRLRADPRFLDPTVPNVRQQIYEDVSRFRAWGFALVKIDYLTYDLTIRWGLQLGDRVMPENRVWSDDTRTSAEVVLDLYRTMRAAAGDDMILIGCNALNHMAAGIFELQRIGDDTSGNAWERTKKMGVNALAFRAIQDGIFFAADADCVGLAKAGAVPWEKNSQWLDLVAFSGTPLFVSWHRKLATPEVRTALSSAYRRAAVGRPTGEPLDWMENASPVKWKFKEKTVTFDWD